MNRSALLRASVVANGPPGCAIIDRRATLVGAVEEITAAAPFPVAGAMQSPKAARTTCLACDGRTAYLCKAHRQSGNNRPQSGA